MKLPKAHKATAMLLLIILALTATNKIATVQAKAYSFTATISPTQVNINQLVTYIVTIANTGESNLGSASISIPLGFTVLPPITIVSPPLSWNYTLSTSTISISGMSGSAPISPGQSVILTFAAIAPSFPGVTNWTAQATSSIYGGGVKLPLDGAQPIVTVFSPFSAPTISASISIINQGQISPVTQLTSASGGISPYTYQWLQTFNEGAFLPIVGANEYNYTFRSTTSTPTGTWGFKLAVTDSSNIPMTITSNTVAVFVNSALVSPEVTATPNSLIETQPSTLTSSPMTTGTAPYVYQWFQKAPTSDYTTVGSNSPSYIFPGSTLLGTWTFLLQVTDGTGASINSSEIGITVSSTPSFTVTVVQGIHGTINPGTISLAHGGSQDFTISPNVGYHVSDVLVDGISVGAVTSYSFANITADHNLTAIFAQNEYALMVSVVGSGSVATIPSKVTYQYGDVVQLNAIPENGWSFSSWSGDLSGSMNPASVAINRATSVVALFSQRTYSLTVSVSGSGSVVLNNSGPYRLGDIVSLTANPSPGWGFNAWSGALSGSASPAHLLINGNLSVTALFTQNTYSLKIATVGSGSVIINPSQSSYLYGDVVQLIAVPAPEWRFGGWTGSLSGSINPSTVEITENSSVTAVFVLNQFTITASASEGGSINPAGITIIDYYGSQAYDITANTGYHLVDVSINGTSVGPLTSYTLSNVTGDTTIIASFARNTLTIHSSASSHGSINPYGTTSVPYGNNQSFIISPDVGYHVADVLVDGVSIGAVSSHTFNGVTTNHTISATFSVNSYSIQALAGPNGSIKPAGTVMADWNTTQSYTIKPDDNYHIEDVIVDGVSVGPVSSYIFAQVTSNHTISAHFALNTFFINLTSSLWSPASSIQVNSGSNYTVSVTDEQGDASHRWVCTGYSLDGGLPASGTSYTFINVRANHTFVFNWQEQYRLTVISPEGSTTGSGWYNVGTTAVVSVYSDIITSNNGTRQIFSGWSGAASGKGVASNPITMDSAKTVIANWKTQYYLTVVSERGNPTGHGWYDAGTTATFSVNTPALSSPGIRFVFNSWTGTTGAYIGTAASSTVTLNHPITQEATWSTQYEVTYAVAGNILPVSAPPIEWVNSGVSANGVFPETITNPAGNTRSILIRDNRSAAVTEPTTITGMYKTQYLVTFIQKGLTSDASGKVATILGNTKMRDQLPINTWVDLGEKITFKFEATVNSTETDKQYILVSPSHNSALTIDGPITIQGDYEPQTSFTLNTIMLSTITLSILPLATIPILAFRRRKKKITPIAIGGGSISPGTPQKIERGGNSTVFIIAANSGYRIADVVIDNTIHLGAIRTYKFLNVNENHTISAIFYKD